MIWPFQRSVTPPNAPERHQTVLDLIEQVTALRGQVRALEAEWLDMRDQVKKSYARMERANERAEKRIKKQEDDDLEELAPSHGDQIPLHGFAKKLQDIRGG